MRHLLDNATGLNYHGVQFVLAIFNGTMSCLNLVQMHITETSHRAGTFICAIWAGPDYMPLGLEDGSGVRMQSFCGLKKFANNVVLSLVEFSDIMCT